VAAGIPARDAARARVWDVGPATEWHVPAAEDQVDVDNPIFFEISKADIRSANGGE